MSKPRRQAAGKRKASRANPAEGKAGGVHKRRQFKRKPRGKKLAAGRKGEDGAGSGVREGGERKPAVKIGVKRKASTGLEGTKRQKLSGAEDSQRAVGDKQSPRKPLGKKERRVERRKTKHGYGLGVETKLVWEQLRRHDLKPEGRRELLQRLMGLITGHMHELAVKHDTARVIQSCLKYGTAEDRTVVFTELKGHIVELSKLRYAKFTAKALLKYCTPSQRHHLIASLYGHVHRLVRHSEAAEILEAAYNDHADASQRIALVQEFYGPQFALFKSERGQPLGEILVSNPKQKTAIIKHMKAALLPLLDKVVVKHSIVHRALLDFMLHCDEESRAEMIESLREVVVGILHTKDGSRVALHCLWHGTPKDRKVILKSFKSYVKKICVEENGHVVLLGVFDTVDDTVLVKKALLTELCGSLEELCDSHYGRRVLLYLLQPRSPQHFSPQFISILTPGDDNKYSKKLADVRHGELLEGVSAPLLQLAGRKAVEWAQSKPHAPLLLQIAASLPGERGTILHPLVELLAQPFTPTDHLAVHPCGHWVVRRLLASEGGGASPEGEESEEHVHFAELLLEGVPASQLQAWVATNRGAFVVCSLLQSGVAGVRERVRRLLEPALESISSGGLKGLEALHRELQKT